MTHSQAYAPTLMKTAFFVLKKSKLLQCQERVLKFGAIDSLGKLHDCENTIDVVFSKLTDWQKYCEIGADEIHIKPAARYTRNRHISYSHNEPSKPAKTGLAIMIAPMMWAPAFVFRLVPVFSLKYELSFDQTLKVINFIH